MCKKYALIEGEKLMRTIFKFNRDKNILIAYELGDATLVESAESRFLDSYGFSGFGREEIYTSLYDEGWKKLVLGENDEIFKQEQIDKKYLGQFLQSNVGVAGHGCDHYYEDEYEYVYRRTLLPKDIMAAFNCVYRTLYYSGFVDKIINSRESKYCNRSVLEEEKAILQVAKRNLEIAVTQVNYDEFNKNNNDMVYYILRSIIVKKVQEYQITSVEDLVEILAQYYHPVQYCLSLYGHYNHKFKSIDEFWASLYQPSEDYIDEQHKKVIMEVFKSFELTPEWLEFIKDVEKKRYKKLTMKYY